MRDDTGETIPDFKSFRRYLGLDAEVEAVLPRLGGWIVPQIPEIADRFYKIMETIPEAIAIFKGGAPQLARQRQALSLWLEEVFLSPHDEAYVERRRRVGIVHLNAGVDEQFMIASMNWLRCELSRVIDSDALPEGVDRLQAHAAVQKALDFDLGITLNSYWNDLHARTMRIDRLALIGQFTAAINHELRNPLGVVTTSVYLMRQLLKDGDGRDGLTKHLDKIDRSLMRANSIVNGLLRLMRVQVPVRHSVDVAEFIGEALAEIRLPTGVHLVVNDGPNSGRGSFDRDQMLQVVENLVRNAMEAMPGGGTVQVSHACGALATTIAVRDEGPGIPDDLRRRVFEPLFSTKPVGTGLGLTLAKAIVEAHGGTLTIGTGLNGKGIGFEIGIPHFLVPKDPIRG